jgi:hypothetical protein
MIGEGIPWVGDPRRWSVGQHSKGTVWEELEESDPNSQEHGRE